MSEISVEVLPDEGAPQVGITVVGLSGAAVVSVDVSWDDRESWHGVRGAQRVAVVGGGFFRDHVPPLNVAAWYRLVVHAGGPDPDDPEVTITVPSATAWLQDPLAPRTAVAVHCGTGPGGLFLQSPSAGTISRQQDADWVTPMGARLPVASVGQRRGPAGVYLHLRALAQEQAALVKALAELLDTAGAVVIRGLPEGIPIDAVAHIVAPDVQDSPIVGGILGPRRDWEMTVVQVRPQSLRVVVPWWTYDQVAALWAGSSYDDVLAARPGDTYVDWLRDPTVP